VSYRLDKSAQIRSKVVRMKPLLAVFPALAMLIGGII
jgi:hypothetical protein